MLTKRTIQLGDYNTATHGWTLASLELAEPLPVTNYVDVPGRLKGPLDLSTALTGTPVYNSRDLYVALEISSGTRQERETKIADLTNRLHGQRVEIIHPDRPLHYAVGRLSVTRLYNDHAHGAVEITGTCEPWLYVREATRVDLVVESTLMVKLLNRGAMPVVPTLEVYGRLGITYNGSRIFFTTGKYEWPELYLTPGEHEIELDTEDKDAQLILTYREAVLR